MVEAVAFVRDDQGEHAVGLEQHLALLQERNQIRDVLDDVTGNDPGVALRPANEFGKRLPGPDKVDLLDVVQVDAVSVVLAAEVRSRCVVECVDVEAASLGRDGVVAGADFESEPLPVHGVECLVFARHLAEAVQRAPLLPAERFEVFPPAPELTLAHSRRDVGVGRQVILLVEISVPHRSPKI